MTSFRRFLSLIVMPMSLIKKIVIAWILKAMEAIALLDTITSFWSSLLSNARAELLLAEAIFRGLLPGECLKHHQLPGT